MAVISFSVRNFPAQVKEIVVLQNQRIASINFTLSAIHRLNYQIENLYSRINIPLTEAETRQLRQEILKFTGVISHFSAQRGNLYKIPGGKESLTRITSNLKKIVEKTNLLLSLNLLPLNKNAQIPDARLSQKNIIANASKSINSDLLKIQEMAINLAEENQKSAGSDYLLIQKSVILLLVLIVLTTVILLRKPRGKYLPPDQNLNMELEKAQVTLHCIGEGVITTDAQGTIEYINLMAQQLTGCSPDGAKGKNLFDVFLLENEEGKKPSFDPVIKAITEKTIVYSHDHMLLYTAAGKHYAIEYTVAPILDLKNKVVGAVVAFRDITDVRNLTYQLAYQASHDSLTELINRGEFEKRLTESLSHARYRGEQHVLCYMDLDQFKVVNDTCGHIAGDELLKQVASLLHHKVRKFDIFGRLGGDEFGMLFLNCPLEKAMQILEVLRRSISEHRFLWKNNSFEITASFGVIQITQTSAGLTQLLSAADTACFVAKDLGGNRIQISQPDDVEMEKLRGEMQWLPRLRDILNNDGFQLYYQRIEPLSTIKDENVRLEVLIRILDDNHNMVSPMAFIPAAERYDLMPSIDRWVIEATFKAIGDYYDENAGGILWSINLSGQTISDKEIVKYISDKQSEYQVNPKTICFEVTETAAVANLSAATRIMIELKKQGYLFALDDFGSGLSSFTYLKNLPVDILKIDGSFVRDINNVTSRTIVASINQIGHAIGLKTIAEYVENESILEKLKELNVDYVQGNLIHKPELLATLGEIVK